MINFRASKIFSENLATPHLNQLSITELSELVRRPEAVVDAARYPIAKTAEQLTASSAKRNTSSHNIIAFLSSAISLEESYNLLKSLWNECLWNGWYIDDVQNEELLKPTDLKREEIYQINLHRWESISQIGLIAEWQSLSIEDRKAILLLPRISVKLVNNRQEISLEFSTPSINSYEIRPSTPDLAITLFLKQEFYPSSVFDKHLPKIQDLTLSQLLAAWRFIATMASDVKAQFPRIEDISTQDDLLRFSPVFSRTALVQLLAKVLPSLNHNQISKIIDLLTFRNGPHDELWHRPLVKVHDQQITTIFMALESPHLSRIVSKWMEDGGLKIDEKGVEFEQVAYKRLQNRNKVSNVEVYPQREFRVTKRKQEDIDLVLRVGQKIIVCEVKCVLFPSTPKQIHNYYQKLEKAAEQAKNKSDFVRDNLEHFFEKVGFSSSSIEEFRVLPLVISNLPAATGYAFQNIPIVDLRILEQYLSDGKFTPYSCITEQELKPLGQEVQFYSSEEEAEEQIEEYLKYPPQIQEVRKNLRWVAAPICIDNQEEPVAFQMRALVQLPQYLDQS